jgi:hypothetical protein
MNEPNTGSLPQVQPTTQTSLDWQLELATAVRAIDPNRVVFFTTRGSSGLGAPHADFSGWQALGDVAFDVHDFFGGRWGSGLNLSDDPGDPRYGETAQGMFNFTLVSKVPPYLGTADVQARFAGSFTDILRPLGIPVFAAEFAGNSAGPGHTDMAIMNLFGTMTAGLNVQGVSWTALSYDLGVHAIVGPDGSIRPWAYVLCNAAAYPKTVTDCPVPPR